MPPPAALHRLAFHRLVLAMGHGAATPATLRGAAELARLLGLGLHCVLVEDEALYHLPALPFARELRMPTYEWRKLDPGDLAADFSHLAEGVRRDLAALGARLGIAQALDVQRGDLESFVGGLCRADDIIVLVEEAPGRWPRPHDAARIRAMALHSAASVLLLPAIAPATAAHPVAALLARPEDPSLEVAARIALAAGAALRVVLASGDATQAAALAMQYGLPGERLTVRLAGGRDADTLAAALGPMRARLLVLDAAAWDNGDLATVLAHARGEPVLLLETRQGEGR